MLAITLAYLSIFNAKHVFKFTGNGSISVLYEEDLKLTIDGMVEGYFSVVLICSDMQEHLRSQVFFTLELGPSVCWSVHLSSLLPSCCFFSYFSVWFPWTHVTRLASAEIESVHHDALLELMYLLRNTGAFLKKCHNYLICISVWYACAYMQC